MQADNNLIWLNKFQDLLDYEKRYGHCNVPATHENQTLFHWVQEQRDDYAKLNMSDERINMLKAVGFDWKVLKDSIWNIKFEQLKLYKSKHGDCNVKWDDENQPLANWIYTQRSHFKHSKMSKERINMLNGIGFNWTATLLDSTWFDNFEQLKLYKAKHGDCNVPCKYDENEPLANWVRHQRSRKLKMSEERINMLNGIGFYWTAPKRKTASRKLKTYYNNKWHDKFEVLEPYKSKHGETSEKRMEHVVSATHPDQDESEIRQNHEIKNDIDSKRVKLDLAIGNEIHPKQEFNEKEQNNEQIKPCNYTTPPSKKTKKNKRVLELELAVGNEIDADQEDSQIEENHEQIANETNYQDSKEKVATIAEKGETSCKRSLQDKVQVLCKLSIMFQKQKDIIYADMKRRKLGNNV